MATDKPVAIVCVGMAGSGKTTFMQRINSHLHSKREPPYIINLDPAVRTVPFDCNIDIRDSLDYKEVMKEYNLGPNGGILTSLNIFATKIDQIINILEKRTAPDAEKPKAKPIKNIIVDTPGQIEVFVWSASGSILLDSLASSCPTVVAYIIDTPRTSSTSTFMSNMLYACSILYKTKLPMILVFNKTDVRDAEFAKEWMTDFEAFQSALRDEENGANGGLGGGSGYMSSLLNSMSLMLEEFYRQLSVVGVSSMTGKGINEFFDAVRGKAEEFKRDYQPELERRREQVKQEKRARKDEELGKLMKDMNVSDSVIPHGGKAKPAQRQHADTLSDLEDMSDAEMEARTVERDEDEADEDDPNDGLADRYKQALSDNGPTPEQEYSEHSFTRPPVLALKPQVQNPNAVSKVPSIALPGKLVGNIGVEETRATVWLVATKSIAEGSGVTSSGGWYSPVREDAGGGCVAKLLLKSEDLSPLPCTTGTLDATMSTELSTSQVPQEQPVNTGAATIQTSAREPITAIPCFSYAQAAKGRTLSTPQPTSSCTAPSNTTERELKRTVSAEKEASSTDLSKITTKRTASEGRVAESRDRCEQSEEQATSADSSKERRNSKPVLKPKDEGVHKCSSVPSSPGYGTISMSPLPKEEDIFSSGNGSSDSTWEKHSQTSQTGVKPEEKTYAEREPSSGTAWDEEAPAPPALKEAPPPILNVWQQRKVAQEAKAKAKQPATQQPLKPSNNNSGQGALNGVMKSSDTTAESRKQDYKRKSKAAAEEKVPVDTGKGMNKDGKLRSSEDGRRCISKSYPRAPLILALADKLSASTIPPPPTSDSISWPTPDSAGGEDRKKPQERSDEGEKEKENAQMQKSSGKKAWTHVPFVPTAVFNTPLPQARRGGRGPSGGGREAVPRGRNNNATNTVGAEKPSTANGSATQAPIVSSDKARANGNSMTASSSAPKPKRASSAGPTSAKEQRKGGDAPGAEKRKEGNTEDVKPSEIRKPSINEPRRPPPVPIPATPQVGRSTGRAPVNENMPLASQTPSRSFDMEKQSQAAAPEIPSHPRNAGPERRSEGSIRPNELPKDFHANLPSRERGDERPSRGRGGHRGRGNANHNAYNAHLPNGYGYANGHAHQYQQPPTSQSRSFSNHERIPSQSQGSFLGPSPHRSFRSASRSHYNLSFLSAGGRFSHGPNQGPPHLPSIQTDLANMSALQNGAQGVMSAMPFDDPYMQQITLFDMVTTQMEYYFSLDNLCKDMFLRRHMDSQGYVFLSVLAGFNRIVQLTTDIELIRYVCLNSQRIEFKPGSLWQDGNDRLRAREDWEKFVLATNQRDPSAQVDAPTPAHGFEHRHGISPRSITANGPLNIAYQSLDAIAPSYTHAAPAVSSMNGTHATPDQPPLSAAVSEFAPSVHSHSSRRFASPDPRSHETKAFTDEEVQHLHIFVRQPINSMLPPLHSTSSRTFSNGSIDGRNIIDELSKSGERQPRPVNGDVFESGDLHRSTRSRSPFIVGSPSRRPDISRSPPVFWAKTKDSALDSLPNELALESYLDFRRDALREREQATTGKPFSNMQNLYNFWSHFLIRNFNAPMYEEFRRLASEDASTRGSDSGMQSLMEYYDEALLGHRTIMEDSIARHYVEFVQSENKDQDRPAFKKLRAAWRNGAFNHKNRHKILKIIDPKLKEELDR
ncbi:MAG: hypothetical protein Q9217_006245 [Psora testacea]